MDKLPEEILIEIFGYLKFNELCRLTLTCKLFNEIISNNSTLMDKFHLKFKDSNISRKYRRVKIEAVNESLIKFLEINGKDICELKIKHEELKMEDFIRIMTLCPNVKRLNIDIEKLIGTNDALDSPAIELTLDSLVINFCDENIFKILQISAVNICADIKCGGSDVIVNLLKTQKHLKTLQLNQYCYELFDDDSLTNVDFQLETLTIGYCFYYNLNHENYEEFLKNQKSLRRFTYEEIFTGHYDCDYENILGKFENIKELQVKHSNLDPMPHVEKLKIYISFSCENLRNFRNFHDIFPNVIDLCIYSLFKIKFVKHFIEPATKKFIEMKIPDNVKSLHLRCFKFANDSLFDDDVDIKIEKLTIYCCDNINWLIKCFKSDRMKLKSLTIEGTKMDKSQHEYLESLTRRENKKIEKLKIYNLMKLNENRDYVCNHAMNDENDVKKNEIAMNFELLCIE